MMDGRYVRVDCGKGQGGRGRCLIESASRKVPAETEESHKPSLRGADLIGRVETQDPIRRHMHYDFGQQIRYKHIFL
jgi:hypothetical protein